MLHDKQNEFHNWQNKLETLEPSAETGVAGNEVAWEKLSNRLREKQAPKNIYWYWAAASLLLVLCLSLLWTKNNNNIVNETVQQKPGISLPVSASIISRPENIALPSIKKVEIQNRVSQAGAIKNRLLFNHDIKLDDAGIKIIAISGIEDSQVKSFVIMPVDSAVAVVSVPVKRKLKVVHINELESAEGQITPNEISTRQWGSNNQKISPVASGNTYAGTFKIKIFLKN
ncbi:MAG: hypothetical protein ABJA37_10155 [Ferruginibacter sp.]